MQILGDPTSEARKVVQPVKPQPKKGVQPQTVPITVLPATHVKPKLPAQVKAPPKAKPKAVGSQGYVNSLPTAGKPDRDPL